MRSPFLVLTLVGALAFTACSGDDDDSSSAGESKETTTTLAEVPVAVSLAAGETVVQTAGADVAVDAATSTAVIAAAQQYVDRAMLAPLGGEVVGDDYATLFDAGVSGDATVADRAALTDEGIPAVTAPPTITASPVRLDALAGPDGALVFVAATFNVTVAAETDDGPIAVRRNAELTYAPNAGAWTITAYRVTVERDLPDSGTSTTTAAAQS